MEQGYICCQKGVCSAFFRIDPLLLYERSIYLFIYPTLQQPVGFCKIFNIRPAMYKSCPVPQIPGSATIAKETKKLPK